MNAYRIHMTDEIGPAKPFTLYDREAVDAFIEGMKFHDDDQHEVSVNGDTEWHWLRKNGWIHTRIHVKTFQV